jgi:hypothetical protein
MSDHQSLKHIIFTTKRSVAGRFPHINTYIIEYPLSDMNGSTEFYPPVLTKNAMLTELQLTHA